MKDNQFFQQGFRGCLISLVCILLAIWAVALSANRQYPEQAGCGGTLGAGFPVLFICDDWGGGSPTGSWEKIDFVDYLNGGIRPGGFLVDFLFYAVLIWIVWFTVSSIIYKGINWRDLSWTIFISIGFLAGVLSAFLLFQPGYYEYIRTFRPFNTPTPTVSTPIGTISTISSTLTPIATSNP